MDRFALLTQEAGNHIPTSKAQDQIRRGGVVVRPPSRNHAKPVSQVVGIGAEV